MNLGGSGVIRYMSEDNVLDFNDALKALDHITKESFSFDVWIPSIERFVKMKEINAKQQKAIIESAIDYTNSKPTFSKVLHDIILRKLL
jgi:hypothetical protein